MPRSHRISHTKRPHERAHKTIRLVPPAREDTRRPDAVPRAEVGQRRAIDAALRQYFDAVARADEVRAASGTRQRKRAQPTAAATEQRDHDDPWLQAIRRLAAAAPPLDRPAKHSTRGRKPTAIGRDHRPLSLGRAMAPVLARDPRLTFAVLARKVVLRLTGKSGRDQRSAYSARQIRLVLALDADDPLDVADRPVWIENLRSRLKRDLRLTK